MEKIIKATCILHNVILDLDVEERMLAMPVQEDAGNQCDPDDQVNDAANELERGEDVRRTLVQYFREQ